MFVVEKSSKSTLLDASIRLLASKGLAVSLREIARAANVSPGLLIHHFGSRERLVELAIQTCLDNLLARKRALAGTNLASGFIELFFDVSESELGLIRQVLVTDSPTTEVLFELASESSREFLIHLDPSLDGAELKLRSALLAAQALGSVVLLPQLRKVSQELGTIDPDSMASSLWANADLERRHN
jgi:AcrR family transcriptional regulator